MKVFVTGATGFLGAEVTRALLASGHSVRAMVRDARAKLVEGAEGVVVRFDGGDALREAINGCEAIIHLAGKVSRDPADASEMHAIHVEATKLLLRAAKAAAVRRFVLASTSGTIAVRKTSGKPATEADRAPIEIIGKWPYYMSKFLQEKEVLASGLDVVVLNPSLLLGPGDDRLSSTADVLKILNGRVPAMTEGTIAFVDVRDTAPAFVTALEKGRRGECYLLNGSNLSVRSFVERVCLTGDVGRPLLQLPTKWALASARVLEGLYQAVDRTAPIDPVSVDMGTHHWACSSAKAERELGFKARDPQNTIRDTVDDLAKRGLFRR